MKEGKKRWYFNILDANNNPIGWGTYYPHGGNCQVYFEHENFAAKQLQSLGDVMLFNDVRGIFWQQAYTNPQK